MEYGHLGNIDFSTEFPAIDLPPTPKPDPQPYTDILQQAFDSALDATDLEVFSPAQSPNIAVAPYQTSYPSLEVDEPSLSPLTSDCSTPRSALSSSSSSSCDQSPFTENRFNDSLSFVFPDPSTLTSYTISEALQRVLLSECSEGLLPFSLISSLAAPPEVTISQREQKLFAQFERLESGGGVDKVRDLHDLYKYQSATIETERYHDLMKSGVTEDTKIAINNRHDRNLAKIIDRVERSLDLVERYKTPTSRRVRAPKPRPLLSKQAVAIMEEWYTQNVDHPYPALATVEALAIAGSISAEQVKKWFANKRNRASNTKSLTEIAKVKRKRSCFY